MAQADAGENASSLRDLVIRAVADCGSNGQGETEELSDALMDILDVDQRIRDSAGRRAGAQGHRGGASHQTPAFLVRFCTACCNTAVLCATLVREILSIRVCPLLCLDQKSK